MEQTPVACTRQGKWIWFAIAFYFGEGTAGVGGVGRFDPAAGVLEVRRPSMLRDASATDLAVIGENAWVATAGQFECSGAPPVAGLVRYHWGSDREESFLAGHGICGFAMHDLLHFDGALWVATDLGVSTTPDPGAERPAWRNFAPDLTPGAGMQELRCDPLFERLLATLPANPDAPRASPFHTLYETLQKHNPDFLERYVERMRHGATPP